MLIFMLVILEKNVPTLEIAFRELTSCIEYKTALVHQDVGQHAIVMPKTRHFDAYCEPRVVPVADVGTKLLLRDPPKREEDWHAGIWNELRKNRHNEKEKESHEKETNA